MHPLVGLDAVEYEDNPVVVRLCRFMLLTGSLPPEGQRQRRLRERGDERIAQQFASALGAQEHPPKRNFPHVFPPGCYQDS
jgi:hypothetical protein